MNQAFRVQICSLFDATFNHICLCSSRFPSRRFVRNQMVLSNTLFNVVCYHPEEFQIITSGTDRKVQDLTDLDRCTGMCLREMWPERGSDRQVREQTERKNTDRYCVHNNKLTESSPSLLWMQQDPLIYSVPNSPSASLRAQRQCPFKDRRLLAYVCAAVY